MWAYCNVLSRLHGNPLVYQIGIESAGFWLNSIAANRISKNVNHSFQSADSNQNGHCHIAYDGAASCKTDCIVHKSYGETICSVQRFRSVSGRPVLEKWLNFLNKLTIAGHSHETAAELYTEISDHLPLLMEVSYCLICLVNADGVEWMNDGLSTVGNIQNGRTLLLLVNPIAYSKSGMAICCLCVIVT